MRRAARVLTAVLSAAAVSAIVYALSGGSRGVGLGTSVVSAATVTRVHYRLNAADASRIDAVSFALRPALTGGSVTVRAGRSTYRCRLDAPGTHAVCATTSPGLAVRGLTTLSIVAAQ